MTTATVLEPPTSLIPTVAPAARAVDATKVYGRGEAEVRALDGVTVDFATGTLHRDHGPVGLRQVDAHAHARRPRLAHDAARSGSATSTSARSTTRSSRSCAATASASSSRRSTYPDAHRRREHHAADAARRPQARPRVARQRRRTVGLRQAPAATGRRSSPAVSSSASRSPGPSPAEAADHLRRRAHRQPRLPHRRRDPLVHASGRARARPDHRDGHPRPGRPRRTPTARCSSPTASIVDEHRPTRPPTRVFDRMQARWETEDHVETHPQVASGQEGSASSSPASPSCSASRSWPARSS